MVLGNYGSDMNIKKRIGRFLQQGDPLQLNAFVQLGVERGELRHDVDPELIASIIETTVERFQDALNMGDSHPDLFHHTSNGDARRPTERINEFILVLRGAIGTS